MCSDRFSAKKKNSPWTHFPLIRRAVFPPSVEWERHLTTYPTSGCVLVITCFLKRCEEEKQIKEKSLRPFSPLFFERKPRLLYADNRDKSGLNKCNYCMCHWKFNVLAPNFSSGRTWRVHNWERERRNPLQNEERKKKVDWKWNFCKRFNDSFIF